MMVRRKLVDRSVNQFKINVKSSERGKKSDMRISSPIR